MQCQYFLLCTNKATTSVPNPIIGDVPCCKRCKDKYDEWGKPRVTKVLNT